MKNKLFFIFLIIILCSHQAYAEHFSCNLDLNLIEDTESTQIKKIVFDVEIMPNREKTMTGNMITSSCFNTIYEPFVASNIEFKEETLGNIIQRNMIIPSLTIGNYHAYNYQLILNYSQIIDQPSDNKALYFSARGKLLPLDNKDFIHQNIVGECTLSNEQYFSPFDFESFSNKCNEVDQLLP